MKDKELLELAAKAAGYTITTLNAGINELYYIATIYGVPNYGHRNAAWNPLTDDGDALRLAVKLRLYIFIDEENNRTHVEGRINGDYEMFTGPHNSDPYAATRRAIVRAAAEIGAQMK